jgi:hypothetical protein
MGKKGDAGRRLDRPGALATREFLRYGLVGLMRLAVEISGATDWALRLNHAEPEGNLSVQKLRS